MFPIADNTRIQQQQQQQQQQQLTVGSRAGFLVFSLVKREGFSG